MFRLPLRFQSSSTFLRPSAPFLSSPLLSSSILSSPVSWNTNKRSFSNSLNNSLTKKTVSSLYLPPVPHLSSQNPRFFWSSSSSPNAPRPNNETTPSGSVQDLSLGTGQGGIDGSVPPSSAVTPPVSFPVSPPTTGTGEAIGSYVKEGSWLPWEVMTEFMYNLHHDPSFGLSWLSCFGVSVLLIRTLHLPLHLKQHQLADFMRLQRQTFLLSVSKMPEGPERQQSLAQFFVSEMNNMMNMMIVSISSLPFFATIFMSIRKVIYFEPEMREAGLWWFEDMTHFPSNLMSAISISLFAFAFYMNTRWTRVKTPPQIWVVGGLFAFLFFLITRQMTVGYHVLIQMNSLTTLLINFVLSRKTIRKMCGLTPYDEFVTDLPKVDLRPSTVFGPKPPSSASPFTSPPSSAKFDPWTVSGTTVWAEERPTSPRSAVIDSHVVSSHVSSPSASRLPDSTDLDPSPSSSTPTSTSTPSPSPTPTSTPTETK